jgi:hypothetical protein
MPYPYRSIEPCHDEKEDGIRIRIIMRCAPVTKLQLIRASWAPVLPAQKQIEGKAASLRVSVGHKIRTQIRTM